MKYKKLKYNVDFLSMEQQSRLYNLLEDNDEETLQTVNEILERYVFCRLAKTVGLTAITGDENFDVTLLEDSK